MDIHTRIYKFSIQLILESLGALVHVYIQTSYNRLTGMKYPLRNLIYDKVKQSGNITDTDLMNYLNKDGISLTEADLNKTLLDLEIYGLIRVSWVTRDKRRIESKVDSTL